WKSCFARRSRVVFAPIVLKMGSGSQGAPHETPLSARPRPRRPDYDRLRAGQPSHARQLRRPRPSPRPKSLVRPLRRLWLLRRDLAAARLRPSTNDREAGRARFASLTPRLRGGGMGDGGWRRIDATASRHFLTLLSTLGPYERAALHRRRPCLYEAAQSGAASARPEAARRAEIFYHRDLATHPNLVVLEPEPERQQEEDRAGRRELQRGQRRIGGPCHCHEPVEPAKKEQRAKPEKDPGVASRRPLPNDERILERRAPLAMQKRRGLEIERAGLIEPHARGSCPSAGVEIVEIPADRSHAVVDPEEAPGRECGAPDAAKNAGRARSPAPVLTARRHCAPPRPRRSKPPSSSVCRRSLPPTHPTCARRASACP